MNDWWKKEQDRLLDIEKQNGFQYDRGMSKEDWPSVIVISSQWFEPIYYWLLENVGIHHVDWDMVFHKVNDFPVHKFAFYFKDSNSALLFKLAWG